MSHAQQWLSSDALLDLLQSRPEGMSEHELLKTLHQLGYIQLDADSYHDLMKLFRMHFLLFHRLYNLRDELHAKGQWSLGIHALSIRVLPYRIAKQGVVAEDQLRRYYLDLSHLDCTSELMLEQMLAGFWSLRRCPVDALAQQQALQLLGLDEKASNKQIKQAWRRMAMRHHPDRGGDDETIKQLNQAVALLLPAR